MSMEQLSHKENCPKCSSERTAYDFEFDFWTCQECENTWSDGLNDPDYDDDTAQASEAIAERNIEQIMRWGRQPNDQN